MPPSKGVIIIKMEKTQAFYAFVGCMLIVSVAFVVGVIVGQRTPTPDFSNRIAVVSSEISSEEVDGRLPALATGLGEASPFQAEEESALAEFTFFDELAGQSNRPRAVLLPVSSETSAPTTEPVQAPPQAEPEDISNTVPPAETIERNTPPPAEAPVAPPAAEQAPAATVVAASPQEEEPQLPDNEEEETAMHSIEQEIQPVDGTRRIQRQIIRNPVSHTGESTQVYTVEMGRFHSYDAAESMRNELSDDGEQAIITLVGNEQSQRYRVQVGQFNQLARAQQTAERLNGLVVPEG